MLEKDILASSAIVHDYQPEPILAFDREAAAHALVGRAEAVIQFQAAAGWLPQLRYPADVPVEVADRVADCVAGREFLLDVVDVFICKGTYAYRPRDVAVCEKLHRYASPFCIRERVLDQGSAAGVSAIYGMRLSTVDQKELNIGSEVIIELAQLTS